VTPAIEPSAADPSLLGAAVPLARRWRAILAAAVLCGALGLGGSFLLTPRFVATATFLPPQQQSSAAGALASLGALAGMGGAAPKSPTEQYVALMQSETVADRLVDEFKLMKVYDRGYRFQARDMLAARSQFNIGKKDGLVTVSVTDTDPARAAAIANRYVDELRRMTSTLAVTEAQRRRMFFEKQMQDAKVRLTQAQTALQGTGFTSGALNAEPKAAAESYARIRAELTGTEVTLQTTRETMTESSTEVQRLLARAQALRGQLAAAEQSAPAASSSPDYVGKYRDFKYEETLFDMMSRQYELARVDEAREGALVQVVDPAQVPEHKSFPKRLPLALGAALVGLFLSCTYVSARARWAEAMRDPVRARRWAELREAFGR
jgi:uncharacterized protein involved in exopolysaccharide biosynthesis